jgi:hypothetical protein
MPVLLQRSKRRALEPSLIVTGSDAHGVAFVERTHAVDVSGSGIRL